MSGIIKAAMLLCVFFTVSGCINPPERQPTELHLQLPQTWRVSVDFDQLADQSWVASFGDPVLSKLVDEALTDNFDLRSTAARVEAAIAQARIDGSGLWPQLSFAPGYQYSQIRSAGFGSAQFSVFEALFNLSWEIDVWGRIRDFRQAAAEEAEAAHFDYQAAQLSLAARIAQNYFALQEAVLQTHVATRSVADRSVIADLVQGRFDRGLARGLDVRLALTDLANAKSQQVQAENRVQLVTRQLETLLGRYPDGSLSSILEISGQPGTVVAALPAAGNDRTLPEPPQALAAGLPSELLTRRPDLIAAFTRLRAADARLQSTQKLLLPRITLTAAGGTRDTALTEMIDPRAVAWNVFAGMAQPLFTGGRIRGNIHLNAARVEEALNRYQSVALNAFREVEQALAAEEWLREQEQALREAVRQTEASQELALYAYRHGFIQILTLLDSYRSTFNAQSAHLAVKRQLLNNRINLYLALGGSV
ncbi:MAG: efflux transporter outer membrane subunit [Nitrosomonas sp.]|nr:efflux transporter outer membrane subunit [Nitrosomonas sp.]MCW5608737.1 efflux transporter outer membrane subunit [Nitrosomonas sp.]